MYVKYNSVVMPVTVVAQTNNSIIDTCFSKNHRSMKMVNDLEMCKITHAVEF